MNEFLGQACGILATVLCLATPLFRQKSRILAVIALVNGLFALNLILIGQVGTGMIMNCIAIVQTGLSYWHLKRDTAVTKTENVLFFVLYVGLGALGFHGWLDVLPILAAVFNMLAIFQKDAQKTRVLIFLNAGIYFSYYCILGATSMFAELLSAISAVVALIRYGKKDQSAKFEEKA